MALKAVAKMALKFHFKSRNLQGLCSSNDMDMFNRKIFLITIKKNNPKPCNMSVPMALSNPDKAAWSWVLYCQRIMQPYSMCLPFKGVQPKLLELPQVLFEVLRC